tara:strand:- start:139 stop:1029 length:891 start_codon:yes stop_codon:yes gene_type:complete
MKKCLFLVNNQFFINNKKLICNKRLVRNKRVITNSVNLVNDFSIGFPLNIFQNIFTTIHYGYDITTFKLILLQFLIGFYTYGKDRYYDSIEYKQQPYETTDKKINLYNTINNNNIFYKLIYDITFLIINILLLEPHFNNKELVINDNILPFLFILYSTEYYKYLKLINPFIKPLYVSSLWTASSIILPCVIYDNNYSILNDYNVYIPCFLSLFAFTNNADIYDINEDKINNVKTLPVCYGVYNTNVIILLSLIISSAMFGSNVHYYDRPIINSMFELQNIVLSFTTPLMLFTNYTF